MTLLEFQNRVREYRYKEENMFHSGYGVSPLKGTKRDNVKYYKRETKADGSYKYYYTQQEYDEAKQREKWESQQEAAKKRIAIRKQIDEDYRKNKEAEEAKIKEEQEKWQKVKWESQQEAAKKRIAQREYTENQKKNALKIEEQKRKEEEARIKRNEELKSYKKKSKIEVDDAIQEIYDNLVDLNKGKKKTFDVDNIVVKLFKEAMAKVDSKFEGDIPDYLDTAWYDLSENDSDRLDKAKMMLNKVEVALIDAIDNMKYDDMNYSNFLDKVRDATERTKKNNIKNEITSTKESIKKVYNGDSNKINIDPNLKKILDDKLKEIDEDYSGDLYKYVRPYLGVWKDDSSYENVIKLLEEMENDLLNDKNVDIYNEFLSKVEQFIS